MASSELQPVLPCLQVLSSRTGSACSGIAAAESVALTDMLQMAPTLLQLLCPKTMAALSSTSRQLRCMVHEYVTSISIHHYIKKYNGSRIQYQTKELQVLTNGNWPHLQHLSMWFKDYLEIAAITQLSMASWSSLTSLDLIKSGLGASNNLAADAMSQLVLGKWPALKRLNLSNNWLDTASIAMLTQADWPLEELTLSDNEIDMEALEVLIQGRWPKMAHLNLTRNKLNVHAVAVLAGQWPLQYLDLSHRQPDTSAYRRNVGQPDMRTLIGIDNGAAPAGSIAKLCEAAAWPQLVSLDLSSSHLRRADVAGLCMAHWPKLGLLDLACNCLDKVSMMHLIKADWPELRHLNLCLNNLDDAAVEVLSHNSWHKMERLVLARNDEVSENAASFLTVEQLRVTIF